ncbi:MAG TPA: hypothetical protein VFA67_05485 [Candidatus Sulfotelmatobacter sp.]|nr:hypothetical protein [Candidatus Sulfotelmatobacter sp.]
MSTNGTAAYAMYPRSVDLPEVVCALNRAGFGNQDICMVLSPAHPDAANVFDGESAKGSASARMISWFSKFGAVFIPTVGFFIRSQSFFQALQAEHNLPGLSRGCRTLLGLGFPHEAATRLGRQLADFGALVYVSCPESAQADGAIQLLRKMGAREASSLGFAKTAALAAGAAA